MRVVAIGDVAQQLDQMRDDRRIAQPPQHQRRIDVVGGLWCLQVRREQRNGGDGAQPRQRIERRLVGQIVGS
jgi:hypothetical protein